ncbi:MAG: Uncharacterized protein CEO21_205, partial [Microgenomates group bacterium Gr01-1014_80]
MRKFKIQNSKFKITVQKSKFFKTFKFLLVLLPFAFLLLTFPVYAVDAPLTIQQQCAQAGEPDLDRCHIKDQDVEFAAKTAARSKEILDWTTREENYQWVNLLPGQNPFQELWVIVRNIVYALLGIAILAAAFLMIITRGRSLTVRKFIPRFIFVIILVALSFSLIKVLYDMTDIIQGFFLTSPADSSRNINNQDLLRIGFQYDNQGNPLGFRLADSKFDEQVWMTTLLLKLTAAGYYAIFAVLVIRKIILWFFLVVSPILPLLLLFPLIRNSAKLWIGEFFRWLLYAPLFVLLLNGLVRIWLQNIPGFQCNPASSPVFRTATDILLGGPCQIVSSTNNLNTPETFAQYLFALIMLWVVIILPFILLKIFLDYFGNYSLTESNIVKYLAQQTSSPLLNRYRQPKSPVPGPGPGPEGAGAGLAKNLPSFEHSAVKELETRMAETARRQQVLNQERDRQAASDVHSTISQVYQQTQAATQTAAMQTPLKISVEEARNQSISSLYPRIAANFVANIQTPVQEAAGALQQAASEVMNLTSLTIPTMKDIVRYETSTISGEAREETSRVVEVINRIAGVSPIATPAEKEKYTGIKERLVEQAQKGNAAAFSTLSAAAPAQAQFPVSNRVQQVNLDDYEAVKKMWTENYRKLEPPMGPDGRPQDRKTWLKQEIKKIPEVIDLLLSGDPEKVKKGKDMVNKILPFLLLGGFSLAEIVAYLKAKMEAAKQAMNE